MRYEGKFPPRATGAQQKRLIMKKQIIGSKVKFEFEGEADYIFDTTACAPAMREYAELHGWEQRLGDAAAISRKQKDGTVITVTEAMRRAEVVALGTYYTGGATAWNAGRAATESPAIQAIATRKGITYAEADALVRALADSL